MSDQGQDQNRTEQATPYKLTKAREKGAVARGIDLAFLTSLAAFAAFMWLAGSSWRARLQQAATDALVSAPRLQSGANAILVASGSVLRLGGDLLIGLGFTVFATVLLFELIQTGPVLSTQPLRPDFSRLNPANGFKRVFSIRLLIETGKNVLKLAVYGAIAILMIRYAVTAVTPAVTNADGLAAAMAGMGGRLLGFFLVAAVAFTILDQIISRQDFQKRMRMTRRDIRRELRDREGDPHLKQKRKQLHRQYIKLSTSLRNIRTADVLIVNPSHYAVALRYDPKSMTAPMIVSMATNQHALRLKRMAFIYEVVIIQDPPLARSLFQRGDLERQIPEALFRPVAEIYITMRDSRPRRRSAA
jgi:flagellar biosynthetic protein FlhB